MNLTRSHAPFKTRLSALLRQATIGLTMLGSEGCSESVEHEAATRLMLRVHISALVLAHSDAVSIVLAREDASGSWQETGQLQVHMSDVAHWPLDVPVVPRLPRDVERPVELIVQALDEDGEIVVEARVVTEFEPRSTQVVDALLVQCGDLGLGSLCESERRCHGPQCRTCRDDQCTATLLTSTDDLHPFRADDEIVNLGDSVVVKDDGAVGGSSAMDEDAESARDTGGGPNAWDVGTVATPDAGTEDAANWVADAGTGMDARPEVPESGASWCDFGDVCREGSTPAPLGATCKAPTECESNYCVEGVCCDSDCTDLCDTCRRDGSLGQCAARDMTQSQLVAHCGGCNIACSSQNVVPRCTAGVCNGECKAGFADCNRDKQKDGCETAVQTDERNCGSCGNACVYGYCAAQACAWTFSGSAEATGSWPLEPSTMRGTWFIFAGSDLVLRALGALVDPQLPGESLRLALYQEDFQGLPERLITQTERLTTLDQADSLVDGKGKLRVEGKVRPTPLDPQSFYWIFLSVSQTTRISANSAAGTNQWRLVAASALNGYPESLPASSVEDSPLLDVYAITTTK